MTAYFERLSAETFHPTTEAQGAWSPDEIHFQHPHLSLAQIHAALGYYYDHKEQIDDQLRRSLLNAERRRADAIESPLRKRLRDRQAGL